MFLSRYVFYQIRFYRIISISNKYQLVMSQNLSILCSKYTPILFNCKEKIFIILIKKHYSTHKHNLRAMGRRKCSKKALLSNQLHKTCKMVRKKLHIYLTIKQNTRLRAETKSNNVYPYLNNTSTWEDKHKINAKTI